MKILFVCSRNQWRSRTAETIFAKHSKVEVKSAGTAASARIKVSNNLINWADYIMVMEQKHKTILAKRFPQFVQKKCIVLNIDDQYSYMDPDLVTMLEEIVHSFMEKKILNKSSKNINYRYE